jgi:hypothetical protein
MLLSSSESSFAADIKLIKELLLLINPAFVALFTKVRHSTRPWNNPFQISYIIFTCICFNIIFPYMLASLGKLSLSLWIPNQNT